MIHTALMNRWFSETTKLQAETCKELIQQIKNIDKLDIKIGDILRGLIINKIELGYVLELDSGVRIPISSLADLNVGGYVEVIVTNKKQNEVQVKIHEKEQPTLADEVVEQLNIKNTKEMKHCVECFIDKELPLAKEQLLKTHHLSKHYNIPPEVIVNTLAKKSGLSEHELQVLSKLKMNGVAVWNRQLKEIILNLNDEGDYEKLINILSKPINLREKTKTLLTVKQAIDVEIERLDVEQDRKEEDLYIQKVNKGSREWLEKLYDQIMIVKPKLSGRNLKTQLEEQSQKILKLIEYIEAKGMEEGNKEIIKVIKEEVQMTYKLTQEGQYFIFSMLSNEGLQQGEIYFFTPNKKKCGKKKENYIVIALDLEALKHIEIHVHKIEQSVGLEIVIESEEIKQYLMKYMNRLKEEIEEMGYTLGQCSYRIGSKESGWGQIQKTDFQQMIIDIKA